MPNSEEDDVIEKTRKWLDKQGQPLEMRTARAFQVAQFSVQQSTYYRTAEGKSREVDVTATLHRHWKYLGEKYDGIIYYDISVVCECKSGGKHQRPWVVFTTNNGHHRMTMSDAYLGSLLGLRILTDSLSDDEPELALFHTPERVGYGIACAFIDGNHSDDAAFSAVSGLVGAALAHSQEEPHSYSWLCRITLPVLVVSTPLIECWLEDDSSLRLEEREMVTLVLGNRPSAEKAATAIHVVHERALERYALLVKEAFDYLHTENKELVEKIVAVMSENPRYTKPID